MKQLFVSEECFESITTCVLKPFNNKLELRIHNNKEEFDDNTKPTKFSLDFIDTYDIQRHVIESVTFLKKNCCHSNKKQCLYSYYY